MNINERMKELVEIINKHSYNYYVLDNPTISDKEWDKLYNELLEKITTKIEEEIRQEVDNFEFNYLLEANQFPVKEFADL